MDKRTDVAHRWRSLRIRLRLDHGAPYGALRNEVQRLTIDRAAQPDNDRMGNRKPADPHPVAESPVGAAQIFYLPTRAGRPEFRVESRRSVVSDHQVTRGITTDSQRTIRFDLLLTQARAHRPDCVIAAGPF